MKSNSSPRMDIEVKQLKLEGNRTLVLLLGPGMEWVEIDGDGTCRFPSGSSGQPEVSINLLSWAKKAREVTA